MSDGDLTMRRVVPGILEQLQPKKPDSKPDGADQPGFADLFSNMINSVNELQTDSGKAQEALMAGEPVELHDVMIKAEEAGLAMDLLLEVRNRLIDGYKEIMRMPM